MKYYENYIPAYSFSAEFADPISKNTIQMKFFNEAGTVLMGHRPDTFENSLDFKIANPRSANDTSYDKEYEDRCKFHKRQQKRVYD